MTLSCKLLLPWGLNFLRVWIGSTTQGWKLGGREEEGKKGKYTIRIRTISAILSLLPLPPSPRSTLQSISSQSPLPAPRRFSSPSFPTRESRRPAVSNLKKSLGCLAYLEQKNQKKKETYFVIIVSSQPSSLLFSSLPPSLFIT